MKTANVDKIKQQYDIGFVDEGKYTNHDLNSIVTKKFHHAGDGRGSQSSFQQEVGSRSGHYQDIAGANPFSNVIRLDRKPIRERADSIAINGNTL
jgi:hypothetical protein